jgi:cyclin-dependent kinase 7
MKDLPDYIKFKTFPGYDLKDVFIAATDDLLFLLKKLLAMDPLKRCSATEVLFNVNKAV